MRSHVRAAPFVEAAVRFDRFQLLLGGERDAVQRCHLVERAGLRAFHARAVVAEDVNDQCIATEAHVLDCFHHATDSVVCVFLVTGINFHLARIHFLYVGEARCPTRGTPGRAAVSLAFAGITPSCFCRANVCSRNLSQP